MTFAYNAKNGAPGACGIDNECVVAINSPQSQNDRDGYVVSTYEIKETRKINPAVLRWMILMFMM